MRSVFECSLIILTEVQNWKLRISPNCIHQHDPTKISLRLKVQKVEFDRPGELSPE